MFLRSSIPADRIQFSARDAVDLQGHCAFCLKACFQSLEDTHNTRTRLVTFSHIWPYFQPKDERETGRLSSAKYVFLLKDVVSGDSREEDGLYSEVPPMCTSCYEAVLKMNFLHLSLTELRKQAEAQALKLREIVAASTELQGGSGDYDTRQGLEEEGRLEITQFFEKVLEKGGGRTKQFLDDLRGEDLATVKTEPATPRIRGNLTCTVPMKRCDQLPRRSLKKSSSQKSSPPRKRKAKASSLEDSSPSTTAKYGKRRKSVSDIVASMIPPACSSPNPREEITLHPEIKMEPVDEEKAGDAGEDSQERPNSPYPLEGGEHEMVQEATHDSPEVFEEGHLENPGDAEVSDDPAYSPSEDESNITTDDDDNPSEEDPAYDPKTPTRPRQLRKAVVRKRMEKIPPPTKEKKDPADQTEVRKRKYKKRKPMKKELHDITQNCDVCNERKCRADIYEHMRTHIQDFAVKCPNSNCGACYLSPMRLEHRHLQCHPECLEAPDGTKLSLMKKCEACDFQCKNSRGFRCHLVRHETATKNFTCPISGCGETFSLRQSVQFHLDVHLFKKTRKWQRCVMCKKKLPLEKLEGHYKSLHDAKEIIKCGSCGFLFPTREHLLAHFGAHQKEGMLCEICGDSSSTKFKRPIALCQHYFTAHGIGSKLVCEYCSKGFWHETNLLVHKKVFHLGDSGAKQANKRKRLYKCDLCVDPVEFKVEEGLFTHKITVHGAEPYACKTCEEEFNTLSALRAHQKVHTEGGTVPKKETFTCERCGKVFRSRHSFQNHTLICVCNAEKSHVCDTCGKGYVTAYLLGRHKHDVHSGFRHVCDICGKGLAGKPQLRRHQMIHTGERPHSCHICDQRFRFKEAMLRHLTAHEKYGDKFQPHGPRERGVREGNKTSNNFD